MEQFTVQDMLGSLGVNTRTIPEMSKKRDSAPQLEYLFEDEYKVAGPSLGSRVCHGTGMSYLTGLALGGAWGIAEGLAHPDAKTPRLRLNAVLNACTRRGPFLGNNLSLIALFYNLIHGVGLKITEREADIFSTFASASTAGMMYRFSKGPQKMLIAGLACGSIMGTLEFLRNRESYTYSLKKSYEKFVPGSQASPVAPLV